MRFRITFNYLVPSKLAVFSSFLQSRHDTSSKDQLSTFENMYSDKNLQDSVSRNEIEQLRLELHHANDRIATLSEQLNLYRRKALHYFQAVENSPNPIFSIDTKGRIETWNPACSNIFLYNSSMIGNHFKTLIADRGQLQFIEDNLKRTTPGNPLSNIDLNYRCKDGSIRTMVSRIYAVHDEENLVFGYIFANTDITERNRVLQELESYRTRLEEIVQDRTTELSQEITDRRKIEEALKSSNEVLITILNTIELEISVTDVKSGEVVFVNKHLNPSVDTDSSSQLPPHLLPHHNSLLKGYRFQQKVKKTILDNTPTLLHDASHSRYHMVYHNLITWVDGRSVLLLVASDITERKRIDQEQERIAKLESIGMLAGGIAHDFNNLLTGIMGNTSLLKIQNTNPSIAGQLEKIEQAALRAKDLTTQLLTFSKGGAPIRELTSIALLLNNEIDFALGGSSIKCHKNISSDLWNAEVDKGQFTQVLHNIVLNSIQAAEYIGELHVIASNCKLGKHNSFSLAQGSYITIVIRDNGPGIVEENLTKIFDPYFTTKSSGNGLGLATAYNIIKKHGGHISASNDEGAVFTLLLPAVEEEPVTIELDHQTPNSLNAKILVMDDDPLVLDVLTEILTQLDCSAMTAENGEDAIAIFEQEQATDEPFDLVILDLTIPGGMGGEETLHHLKAIDSGVKAIVSSGYSINPVMAEYERYGFGGVVSKPYKIEEMYEVLAQLLQD